MFGFECPPYRGDNPEAISQANPSGSKELMLVLVINKLGLTQFGKRLVAGKCSCKASCLNHTRLSGRVSLMLSPVL